MELNRCRGLMLGMAAGDKNRSPFKIALCLLQSIVENDGIYDPHRSLLNYLIWYCNKDIGWDESGPVTKKVLQWISQDLNGTKDLNMETIKSLNDIYIYAEKIDEDYKGFTTDIDPVYRSLPLALLSNKLSEEQLIRCIRTECQITHKSEIAQSACISIVLLLSLLIKGQEFEKSAREVARKMSFCFPVKNAILEGLEERCTNNLSRGSYCVDVIKASIYCVQNFRSLSAALDASILLAGSFNFCPVLVGALAGANEGCNTLNSFKIYTKQWEPRDLHYCESYINQLQSKISD